MERNIKTQATKYNEGQSVQIQSYPQFIKPLDSIQ
uniref:Uncharacterized protein n=1 Tax=Rhizophora mucronata TaxID=61149 RepID=A0A2P2MK30_RHIMU